MTCLAMKLMFNVANLHGVKQLFDTVTLQTTHVVCPMIMHEGKQWGLFIAQLRTKKLWWYDGKGKTLEGVDNKLGVVLTQCLDVVMTDLSDLEVCNSAPWQFEIIRGSRQFDDYDGGVYIMDCMRRLVKSNGENTTRLHLYDVIPLRLVLASQLDTCNTLMNGDLFTTLENEQIAMLNKVK